MAEQLAKIVNTNELLRVLQSLLSEHMPICDMRTIAETLAAVGEKSQYSVTLTAAIRIALNRVIVQSIYGERSELLVIAPVSKLEQLLLRSILQFVQSGIEQESELAIELKLTKSLQKSLVDAAPKQELPNECAVLFVAALLKPTPSRFARYTIDGLHMLSYQEMPDNKKFTVAASLGSRAYCTH
ncbi:MAG: flagellar biosynthesis protein FlhA [Glaciecola sp.]